MSDEYNELKAIKFVLKQIFKRKVLIKTIKISSRETNNYWFNEGVKYGVNLLAENLLDMAHAKIKRDEYDIVGTNAECLIIDDPLMPIKAITEATEEQDDV